MNDTGGSSSYKSRIKKIMQTDEDVGKIALAVPVLVSKALELFLQDLCDRTYSITLQRGLKTMSALHLKQCIHSFNAFDFLKDVVKKVPDIGGTDAGGDDRSGRKRKAPDEADSEDESKRTRNDAAIHASGGRGRGRGGRGRGRPRSARSGERDGSYYDRYVDDLDISPQHDNRTSHPKLETLDEVSGMRGATETISSNTATNTTAVRNFDLNLNWDENGDASAAPPPASTATPASETVNDIKNEEYPGWSISDMKNMAIDPVQFALSHQRLDEEEEDYDNEDG
ncbi:dr1-associated corepressor-like isoform X2 [Ananas comosus]|uniref:Dr1-associated corepressor-like isoform X2 n=1 Tax=Ananas comosus TaxID=4615 RepID=A0A6P5FVR3_ANACO|nr:dr1-associated corepressor-like isoform X2 [Ananas comosus]